MYFYGLTVFLFRLMEPVEVKMMSPGLKWTKLEEEAKRFYFILRHKTLNVLLCFCFTLHVCDTFWTVLYFGRRKKTMIKEAF